MDWDSRSVHADVSPTPGGSHTSDDADSGREHVMEFVSGELIPQGGGDNIPLMRTPLVLGRRESCDVCLQFPNISGKHCELAFKDGFWVVRDLNSTNGIKVNGERVLKKLVLPGDTVTIGKRTYTIQYALTRRASEMELEEEMEDMLDRPLLEKAGLEKPKEKRPRKPGAAWPDVPLSFDDDDDDDD